MNTQMAVDGWGAFIAANPEVALGPHDEWERWEIFPDGSSVIVLGPRFPGWISGVSAARRVRAMRIVEAIRDGIAQDCRSPLEPKWNCLLKVMTVLGLRGGIVAGSHCSTKRARHTRLPSLLSTRQAIGAWKTKTLPTDRDGVEEVACQNGGTPYLASRCG